MPSQIKFSVVNSLDDQMQAYAIRVLVYVGEQSCPWTEEFDGNDYTATHILGRLDGEPVATARIRWFGEFAKLERLAIRPEYRGAGSGHALIKFMIELCAAKGFRKLYLHAQARLEAFYRGYGFETVGESFAFSDHDYLEMIATLSPCPNAIGLSDGPFRINRPEGHWHVPGVLDHSVERKTSTTAYLRRLSSQKGEVVR